MIKHHLLAILVLLLIAVGCDSGDSSGESNTPPVLSVPVIDLSTLTEFLPFGIELSPGQLNPAYEFRTNSASGAVVAASAGEVVDIISNPPSQGDFEIVVEPADNAYRIYYDHVLNLEVAVGDNISAGDTLGTIGNFGVGAGRVEIQINHTADGTTVSRCPEVFGTTSFNSAHATAYASTGTEPGGPCLEQTVDP